MGLDVYKYRVLEKSVIGDLTTIKELRDSNHSCIIKDDQLENFEDGKNKSIEELFARFSDDVVILKEYIIDYKFYEELLAKENKTYTDVRLVDYNAVNVSFADGAMKTKILADFAPGDMIVLLLKEHENHYEVVLCANSNDIKRIDHSKEVLILEDADYCRKSETDDLYKKFFGDCWYSFENAGLTDYDKRWYVQAKDLDELKECFEKNSDVRTWTLANNEFIYLSA